MYLGSRNDAKVEILYGFEKYLLSVIKVEDWFRTKVYRGECSLTEKVSVASVLPSKDCVEVRSLGVTGGRKKLRCMRRVLTLRCGTTSQREKRITQVCAVECHLSGHRALGLRSEGMISAWEESQKGSEKR